MRATAVLGGSQVVIILLNIVRGKAFAVLLGPTGVGVSGMYLSIVALVNSVAGLGLRNSGVKEVAAAVGSSDARRIALTVKALRRACLITGTAGMVATALLAEPLSRFTFGTNAYVWGITLMSATILMGQVAAGQSALLQGFRRIGDLAKVSVLGVLAGVLVGVPVVYFLGMRGIALSLVAASATTLLASWLYARRVSVTRVHMSLKETWAEAKPLLRLGVVFMLTGLMATGTTLLVRVLVSRMLGTVELGLYQAGQTVAGLYVNMIIAAMITDYYPRLAAAPDQTARTVLANEQAETGLLIALPGVLATMALAPLAIRVFYSSEFLGAVSVMEWQGLGLLFRILSWPVGYVLQATGDGRTFLWTELGANIMSVGFIWLGISLFGLAGAGIYYFAVYFVFWIAIYLVVRRRHGFRWSSANMRLWAIVMPATAVIFIVIQVVPQPWAMVFGTVGTLAMTLFAARRLSALLGESVLVLARRQLTKFMPRRHKAKGEED